MARSAWLALLVLTGCSFEELDLSDRSCPCAEGFVCDVPRNRCVADPTDAGAEDRDAGGMDAALVDAGPARIDAGPPPVDGGDDAGAIDAGVDAGPFDAGPPPTTVCGVAPFDRSILCEDFETSGLPGWSRSTFNGGGDTVERSTMQSYLGSAALRVREGSRSDGHVWLVRSFPRETSGTLWLRAYLYVESTAGARRHIVYVGEGVANFLGVNLVLQGSDLYALVEGPDVQVGRSAVPTGRWVCVRTRIDIDGSAGAVTLEIDGTQTGSRSGIDTLTGRGFETVDLGGVPPSNATTGTHFLDELALSTEELPCD